MLWSPFRLYCDGSNRTSEVSHRMVGFHLHAGTNTFSLNWLQGRRILEFLSSTQWPPEGDERAPNLTSSGMHLPVWVEPELIGFGRSRAFRKLLTDLRAAIFAFGPGRLEEGPNLVSRGTIT